MEKILKEISSKLDVVISLMLKGRSGIAETTIRQDALMLNNHGVSREDIAAILGSTERSIGEYLRPGRKSSKTSVRTKK